MEKADINISNAFFLYYFQIVQKESPRALDQIGRVERLRFPDGDGRESQTNGLHNS
jgi:hypothetical protein